MVWLPNQGIRASGLNLEGSVCGSWMVWRAHCGSIWELLDLNESGHWQSAGSQHCVAAFVNAERPAPSGCQVLLHCRTHTR